MVATAGHRCQSAAPAAEIAGRRQVAEQPGHGRGHRQRRHTHHRHRSRRGRVHRHTGDHHMHRPHTAVDRRVQFAHERSAARPWRPDALHQPGVPVPQSQRPERPVPHVSGRVLQQQLRHAASAQAVVRVVTTAAVIQRPQHARALHAKPLLHTVRRRRRRKGLRDEHEIVNQLGCTSDVVRWQLRRSVYNI